MGLKESKMKIAEVLKHVTHVTCAQVTVSAFYADEKYAGAIVYDGDPLLWRAPWAIPLEGEERGRLIKMIFALRRGRLGPKGALP